ncbi:MAG: site-2 protease family protein [Candidatus Paceibacterota bacterium]
MIILISIIILIFSVIIHEVAHGFMAEYLGDPTARLQGRLTLNPLKHLDPVGSIIVPLITSLAGFTFGWAKPVEFNPYNLKNRRQGEFLIALAGPLSNLLLALIFGIVIRVAIGSSQISMPFVEMASYIVLINIILAVFNLIPLPPLDGSKLLFAWLPEQYGRARLIMETYAPLFILVVVFFLWQVISPVIPYIYSLITGIAL